ncbi:MAG: GyrI-like domain-containing protein, partial [Eubacteriales bacterium]|nr:GyrI-like domain-containing protein [Eubacteriales bacterium]
MAFDFKKEYRAFYLPKGEPEILSIPEANYIAIRGQGDPNEEGGAYKQAIGVLYAIAYTLKMSYKTGHVIPGFYVPTDFDTIEKAFSGVKTAEKGIKQGLSRSITDSESPFSLYSVVDFC